MRLGRAQDAGHREESASSGPEEWLLGNGSSGSSGPDEWLPEALKPASPAPDHNGNGATATGSNGHATTPVPAHAAPPPPARRFVPHRTPRHEPPALEPPMPSRTAAEIRLDGALAAFRDRALRVETRVRAAESRATSAARLIGDLSRNGR